MPSPLRKKLLWRGAYSSQQFDLRAADAVRAFEDIGGRAAKVVREATGGSAKFLLLAHPMPL